MKNPSSFVRFRNWLLGYKPIRIYVVDFYFAYKYAVDGVRGGWRKISNRKFKRHDVESDTPISISADRAV